MALPLTSHILARGVAFFGLTLLLAVGGIYALIAAVVGVLLLYWALEARRPIQGRREPPAIDYNHARRLMPPR